MRNDYLKRDSHDDVNLMLKAAREIYEAASDATEPINFFEAMQIACLMEANRVASEVRDNLARLVEVTEGV